MLVKLVTLRLWQKTFLLFLSSGSNTLLRPTCEDFFVITRIILQLIQLLEAAQVYISLVYWLDFGYFRKSISWICCNLFRVYS